MSWVRTALAAIVAMLAITAASAQSGGLKIVVTDSNNEPLPGATVTISHPQGYVKETPVFSDAQGVAEFPVLRATGQNGIGYVISVVFPGYAPQRHADVKIRIGDNMQLAIQLSEEIVEKVTVKARSDVVDLERTAQATKFSDEFVDDLPVPGRFYQNVLTLAPGVQDSDGDGNPNVHGARDRDFKAVVGGVSNVDPLTGQRMFDINPNSIEEIEVLTAGAGIEFRRAQGGFARILQKQGSNDFEGTFEFYYRSDLFDGDGAGDFSELENPGFDSYQPAVQLSGPIVKDKLWYYLSHEWIHDEDPVNVTDGIEVVTDERTVSSDKLTWQVSPRNKLDFQYQADPREISNFGVSNLTPAESAAIQTLGGEQLSLTWTAPFSPKILIESQVAWQDINTGLEPTSPNAAIDCLAGGNDFIQSGRCEDVDSGQVSGGFPFNVDDHRQRLTVRGDTTLYGGRFWGMNHQFKVGISMENERYFRDLTVRPDIDFFIIRRIDPGSDAAPEPRALFIANVPVPERTQVRSTGITWGMYFEDQIKPLQNLTVTIGAGLDREEISSNGNGNFVPQEEFDLFNAMVASGITDEISLQEAFTAYESLDDFFRQLADRLGLPPDTVRLRATTAANQSTFWAKTRRSDNINLENTNLSPALAVSWDPWSNGKTKFSATARRYYGITTLNIPLIELNAPSAPVSLEAQPYFDPETQQATWQLLPGPEALSRSISPAVNVDSVDRNLETPYNDEFTLSVEREIATETAIKVTYINRKFRDQYQDMDLNHVAADFGRCQRASLTNPTQPVVLPVTVGDAGYDPLTAPGDGVLDDCAGDFDAFRGQGADGGNILLQKPDGILDLYINNPGWGNLFFVGNINRIDYEGYTLEVTRRQYRNWEATASYTYSEAFGDGEDFNQAFGDDPTLIEDEQGYQAYDQRHVVKMSATTITPWGFRLGGNVTWQSGLPWSILTRQISFDAVPPQFLGLGTEGGGRTRTQYPTGVRNSERNSSYWDLNIKATKELRLGRGLNGQISAEIFNLLNDGTYTIYSPFTESGQQVNGINEAFRRFGRSWQLGMKLAF